MYNNNHNNHHYGHDNPNFIGDAIFTIPGESRRNITEFYPGRYSNPPFVKNYKTSSSPTKFNISDPNDKKRNQSDLPKLSHPQNEQQKQQPERDSWGKGIEFLLSCIAMSVGLGNIWRFPFVGLFLQK
jgi:hypothetical protein